MKRFSSFITIAILFLCAYLPAHAQCSFKNTAFKSGEFLSYNMYYNWQFVWVKAGTASMSLVQSNYKGTPAYRAALLTSGSERADRYFVLRDTILCYSSLGLEPLYFRKGSRHDKQYTVDEVFYSYANNKPTLKQHRQRRDGEHEWKTTTFNECVYDMLNIVLRARSFNPEGWKTGNTISFTIADGRHIQKALLRYNGKKVIKADNGKKYRCLELSYLEQEEKKNKEIIRFFVTDDSNHIPIRLDMFLKFGSAKAFLVGMKGIKNAIASEVQ